MQGSRLGIIIAGILGLSWGVYRGYGAYIGVYIGVIGYILG